MLNIIAAKLNIAVRLLLAALIASVKMGSLAIFFYIGKQLVVEFKLNRY